MRKRRRRTFNHLHFWLLASETGTHFSGTGTRFRETGTHFSETGTR
jgi:hypothetical protein